MTDDAAERGAEALRLARSALAEAEAAQAANNIPDALRWFERLYRLLPQDHYAALRLALVSLGVDAARAETLFARLLESFDLRDAWLGLAAARLRLANPAGAASALATALSRHATTAEFGGVAEPVARAAAAAGWCGLSGDGVVTVQTAGPGPVEIRLDDRLVRKNQLPARWATARTVTVAVAGRPLLGSPIDVAAIRRLEGFVAACAGGLQGWAWYPSDPDTDPVLTIDSATGRRTVHVTATDSNPPVADGGPLPRQRRFSVPADALRGLTGLLHVRGRDGDDVMGSPLDPGFEQRTAIAAAAAIAAWYPARPDRRAAVVPTMPPAIPVRTRGGITGPDAARSLHSVTAGAGPRSKTFSSAASQVMDGALSHVTRRRGGCAFPDDSVNSARALRATVLPKPPAALSRRRAVEVVYVVGADTARASACLNSVLATVQPPSRVLVVDDATNDPAFVAALDALTKTRRIRLIRHPRRVGFAVSANVGITASASRDVVLLTRNVMVPPGWLDRLADTAYSEPAIGSVTPLSNDGATVLWARDNAPADVGETVRLDRLAQRANGTKTVEVPVGGGGCLYLRRDCLDTVGLLRADLFAQGHAADQDFCLRARHFGWRHVALPGLFVTDTASQPISLAERHLRVRNERLLQQLHPGYDALIGRFREADPLMVARRRLDQARWQAARKRGATAAILLTHNDGGGVEQRIIASVASHRAAGRRAIVLRPATMPDQRKAVLVCDGTDPDYPDLRFAMPDESADLLRLLLGERPVSVEVHHLLGHHPSIYHLLKKLSLPWDVHVHDYPWFCQRVSLVGVQDRYCGEPDPDGCEACIADAGRVMEEEITVTALLHRSTEFLTAARRVVAPSHDAAVRMQRHFPGLRPDVRAHEDDDALDEPGAPQARDGRCRVCVVGAVGVHKGYDVLLACARDAAKRDLPLDFILVGTSIDDARLMATGRIFVTGYYQPDEAVDLIRRQNASLALLPSIWPETWCLVLTEIWRAGLQAAAFDLGAPAERISRTGRGFLMPPNLPPRSINNVLVASVGLARHESLLQRERM